MTTHVPGDRLRAFAERHDLTHTELAHLLGLPPGAIGSYMRQGRSPRLGRAADIQILTGGQVRIIDWLEPGLRAQVEALEVAEPFWTPPESNSDPTLEHAAKVHVETGGVTPILSWLDPAVRAALRSPISADVRVREIKARRKPRPVRRKLSANQRAEIIARRQDGQSYRAIAADFNVSDVTIMRVCRKYQAPDPEIVRSATPNWTEVSLEGVLDPESYANALFDLAREIGGGPSQLDISVDRSDGVVRSIKIRRCRRG